MKHLAVEDSSFRRGTAIVSALPDAGQQLALAEVCFSM